MQVQHNQVALVVIRKMGRCPRFPVFGSKRQTQKFLMFKAIENGHADTVIAPIEAKVNINAKNAVSVSQMRDASILGLCVSIIVCL